MKGIEGPRLGKDPSSTTLIGAFFLCLGVLVVCVGVSVANSADRPLLLSLVRLSAPTTIVLGVDGSIVTK